MRGEAGFASGGLPTAEDAVFPIDSGDTSPCVPGAVIEICFTLHSLYPAGAGSIVTGAGTPRVETGGNFLLAAFDQAALAAIFAALLLFGLAPD